MKNSIKFILLTALTIGCFSCNDKSDLRPAEGPTLKIGDEYYGGAVFYVEQNGKHGLVACINAKIPTAVWSSFLTTIGATKDTLYSGEFNTNLIVSSFGSGNYASRISYDLKSLNFTDWYLPSKYELNLLRLQNNNIPSKYRLAENYYYWTSTEFSNSQAWCLYISGNLLNQSAVNKTQIYNVKSISKF